jgi:hypothetical protein
MSLRVPDGQRRTFAAWRVNGGERREAGLTLRASEDVDIEVVSREAAD